MKFVQTILRNLKWLEPWMYRTQKMEYMYSIVHTPKTEPNASLLWQPCWYINQRARDVRLLTKPIRSTIQNATWLSFQRSMLKQFVARFGHKYMNKDKSAPIDAVTWHTAAASNSYIMMSSTNMMGDCCRNLLLCVEHFKIQYYYAFALCGSHHGSH